MTRIPGSIKRPSQLLGGSLGPLMQHARQLIELQNRVRAIIPGEIHVASIDAGTLHLIVPSAGLATRVRYNQRKLIARLHQPGKLSVERVKVSVRPDAPQHAPDSRTARPPSAESGRSIASTAKYIEDAGLRKALMKLADRAKPE
ncbi:MAG: DUF721 domain-containing protein [Pseudomonadales bacterium]|nr:DUF721 domain-containing protein [Pseudomonadales bacterium]